MEKNRKTTTTSSFCVEVSRSCKSLRKGLSPHFSKFSRFNHSRWAFLAQTRIGYCCCLDLKAALTMQTTSVSSTDRKNMDVMCITHVGSCFFTFRAFDSDANEKTAFAFAKNLTMLMKKMPEFQWKRPALMGINVNVTNALPFCNPTRQLTVLTRSGDSFMEFKVMYIKKLHGNRIHSRIRNGWGTVVRKLGIKHRDRCTFTLMDPECWSYELTVTPGNGCSEFQSQVVDMVDLDD